MTVNGSADRTLPDELAERVQTAFGFDEPPATFADWAGQMVATYEADLDRELGPDDLCAVEDSNHMAVVGDDVRHYQCVLDALVLGYLVADQVTVRSVPPTSGTEVRVALADEGVTIEPADSVMSFGVAADVDPPDRPVTPESMYGKLCPYGHAFPSQEAYDEWAASSPSVSTAVPLRDGLAIARTLLDLTDLDRGPAGAVKTA